MLICLPYASLYAAPASGEVADEGWYGQRAGVLGEAGGCLRVRMEYGYEGYIRREALADWELSRPMTVSAAFADVMDAPRYQAGRLMTLPRGALVDVREECGDWVRTALIGGGEGYLRRSHIRESRSSAPPYSGTLRRDIVDTALSYMGVPYRWGGRTPEGVDCSGLCHAAYLLNGVTIYRDSGFVEGYALHKLDGGSAAAGDLLYFRGHVGIYIGGSRYIHATGRAGEDRVRINSLDPLHPDYREDLASMLMFAGSVF